MISIPASRRRSSPRPHIASLGSRTPITTLPIRLSMILSAHASFGLLRVVHGSRVVKRVAPARVSSPSFFSSNVNSACSPGESSPGRLRRSQSRSGPRQLRPLARLCRVRFRNDERVLLSAPLGPCRHLALVAWLPCAGRYRPEPQSGGRGHSVDYVRSPRCPEKNARIPGKA